MIVLDAAQMRAADALASSRDGEATLMRRAGEQIAQLIRRLGVRGRIVGIAGRGNNGADVSAAFAALGREFETVIVRTEDGAQAVADALDGAALVLDGILGVGARLPLPLEIAAVCERMNASGVPILALDLPTGIDPTSGAVDPHAIRATWTLFLGAPKLGALLLPAREFAGELWNGAIGIDAQSAVSVCTEREFLDALPKRAYDSDKRRSGAPLVIAGSEQFPGAAVLCTHGAQRAGAGYVTTAVPRGAVATVRAHLLEAVAVAFDDASPQTAIDDLLGVAERSTAIAIGPGLGLSPGIGEIVRGVLARTTLPVVIDASALFHLAKHLDVVRDRPFVLTPHAGEFARLSGEGTVRESDRIPRLRAFTQRAHVTTLLKGTATLIDDGTRLAINPTGTPALATAGTGDTLTGMIATLLAQGLAPFDAARIGAYWHGFAGRLAAEQRPVGVIASDVADHLGDAVQTARAESFDPALVRIV